MNYKYKKTKWQLKLEKEIKSFNRSLRYKNKKQKNRIFDYNAIENKINYEQQQMNNSFSNAMESEC